MKDLFVNFLKSALEALLVNRVNSIVCSPIIMSLPRANYYVWKKNFGKLRLIENFNYFLHKNLA